MSFFELHHGLPREGPGDDRTTEEVLQSLPDLPHHPDILDIGCGPGAQTLVLARVTGGTVTAVDHHQPFLEELMQRARSAGCAHQIRPVCASMEALPFEECSFDLIWSEAAIYLLGFEAGLRAWRRFLRPSAFLVVSEATWLAERCAEKARLFWNEAYRAMTTRARNRETIRSCGYEAIAEFVLPAASWFSDYYAPLEKRIAELSARNAADTATVSWLQSQRTEIDVARRYPDAVGYVFYVARLVADGPPSTHAHCGR